MTDGDGSDAAADGRAPATDEETRVFADSESSDDDGTVGPAPDLDPAAVVRAQLDALDVETADSEGVPASVRTLFDFAAPEFRTAHGSLDGFATTLRGPLYDCLIETTGVERGPSERENGEYVQTVVARHPDGDRTYEFVLARQTGGKYDGCWMTTAIDLVYDGESPTFRRTPTVRFEDRELTCEVGDELRSVLLAAEGYSPHNDVTQVANCGGNGLCGTCAVDVEGEVDEMGSREKRRLSLPPHDEESGLRLSCQTHVQGDVTVRKHGGAWGQHVSDLADDEDESATAAAPITVTEAEYAGEYDYAAGSEVER